MILGFSVAVMVLSAAVSPFLLVVEVRRRFTLIPPSLVSRGASKIVMGQMFSCPSRHTYIMIDSMTSLMIVSLLWFAKPVLSRYNKPLSPLDLFHLSCVGFLNVTFLSMNGSRHS